MGISCIYPLFPKRASELLKKTVIFFGVLVGTSIFLAKVAAAAGWPGLIVVMMLVSAGAYWLREQRMHKRPAAPRRTGHTERTPVLPRISAELDREQTEGPPAEEDGQGENHGGSDS